MRPDEERRTEIIVEVLDRPGQLAKIGEVLGDAGVNIVAAAAVSCGGASRIHLVVDDESAALVALKRAEIKVARSREVLVVTLDDRPGELGRFARSLADRDLNISALYISGEHQGDKELIVAFDDPEA